MKHKSVLFFLLACSMMGSVRAQVDTLGKCPFYYMDTAVRHFLTSQYDSCIIRAACDEYPRRAAGFIPVDIDGEYAIQMHTDDTIRIAGIALGGYDCRYPVRLAIYDSAGMYQENPVPLATTTMPADVVTYDFSTHTWVLSDSSNLRHMWHPGLLNPISLACLAIELDYIWLSFFEDGEVLEMTGDFFVGISSIDSPYRLPQAHAMLGEYHDPPLHFPTLKIRVEKDKEWGEYTLDRVIPIVFPIVEPACESVGEVTVETDSMGCIVATWDSLARQDRWEVTLRDFGSGVTVTDTVGACRWEYCGLPDGAAYDISVRARCANLNTYTWSDGIHTEGVGIAPVALGKTLHVSPNPTRGVVRVDLPEAAARDSRVEVYGTDGRQRAAYDVTPASTAFTLDLGNLEAGLYLLRLVTPEGVYTCKMTLRE